MADNNLFELKIIEPDGMFFEGEGEFLEFTSVEGQMGVYKNHIPLTTILEPCVVKIHANGETKKAVALSKYRRSALPFWQKIQIGRKRLMWSVLRRQSSVPRNVLVKESLALI